MKRIEDEEVQAKFEDVFRDRWSNEDKDMSTAEIAEHFFQAGRDSLAKEFWTARPKRTISRIIVGPQGNLFALSSDGRLYGLRGFDGAGLPEWLPYTELPQED